MRQFWLLGLMALALPACAHVAGVVTTPHGQPLRTAEFSIGRPTDIANYGTHPVDKDGKFSFYIFPPDETNLYVYDKSGDVRATLRAVDRSEISDHMHLTLQPADLDVDPAFKSAPFSQ